MSVATPTTSSARSRSWFGCPAALGGVRSTRSMPWSGLTGDPAELADSLRAFAREGIAHVQLVVDPITTASIRALGPAHHGTRTRRLRHRSGRRWTRASMPSAMRKSEAAR